MELQQLRYFIEVANSQHITKSAERLHISQPSLSQSIKRLENELGVALFASYGRNIVLTESGRYLLEKVEPIMRKLDALPEQLREFDGNESTTIHLHVAAASRIVSKAVIEYRRRHHNVNFRFLMNDDDTITDMSISSELTPPVEKGENIFTCKEKIYLAVPGDSLYKNREQLAEFRDEDFIALISQKQFRRICDRLCAVYGFTPNITFESDSPETVRNMIAANMGVGFWPAFTWGNILPGNVRLVEIEDSVCSRYIVIKNNKSTPRNKYVTDFYKFLTDYMLDKMYEAYGIK